MSLCIISRMIFPAVCKEIQGSCNALYSSGKPEMTLWPQCGQKLACRTSSILAAAAAVYSAHGSILAAY